MCTNKLIKWHSKYFSTVPDIISAMRKNCVWFLLFKYKATALALTQIKLLAPLLTLLQLVPHNPAAQSTGTDASRCTLKGTHYRLKSVRFGPGRTRFKISTSKMAF